MILKMFAFCFERTFRKNVIEMESSASKRVRFLLSSISFSSSHLINIYIAKFYLQWGFVFLLEIHNETYHTQTITLS